MQLDVVIEIVVTVSNNCFWNFFWTVHPKQLHLPVNPVLFLFNCKSEINIDGCIRVYKTRRAPRVPSNSAYSILLRISSLNTPQYCSMIVVYFIYISQDQPKAQELTKYKGQPSQRPGAESALARS